MKRMNNARILIYSHDTFGLGHLRRCRAIAHALVERFKGLTVLIISGSQIAGAFDFKARVDFVKIPSVIKPYSGDYTSISEHISITDTLTMRKSLILETAHVFDPNIFIVDKEPMGLHNEVEPTLRSLKEAGCTNVLGLRDVMDSPALLKEEWDKKNVTDKIAELYDDIWVYGSKDFWNPLQDIDIPQQVTDKLKYSGFLKREMQTPTHPLRHDLPEDYLLVTAGGGGDGADIMSWVLSAYEHDKALNMPLVLVTGPFMKSEQHEQIQQRASELENVSVIEFDNEIESIMGGATAIVGMCGYNTFCEIVSFDKPALFIPRTHPREEQLIRASRAAELGVAGFITPDEAKDPNQMSEALNALLTASTPSKADWDCDLSGLDWIGTRIETILSDTNEEAVSKFSRNPQSIQPA